MAKQLSYADAVKVLGGSDSRVVRALDNLMGGVLLVGSAGGSELALGLFDGKAELTRMNRELVAGLGDRVHGLGRFDRTRRLHAACTVLSVVAYFEALDEVALPFDPASLGLDRADQVRIASGARPSEGGLRGVVAAQGDAEFAELTEAEYRTLGENLTAFAEGLAVWDGLNDTERERTRRVLTERVPQIAVRRQAEELRRLAGEFPEVAFWLTLREHRRTGAEISALGTGLASLETTLGRLSAGRDPDEQRAALARRYRAVLARPVIEGGEDDGGFVFPSLADGYLDPRFRDGGVTTEGLLHEETWWDDHEVRDGFADRLASYLLSVQAVTRPLLVLGQPGAGKSLLTKVIAARLPASDFLPVRVPLREVSADADLQTQIETAIRADTGEDVRWPAFARSAGGAMPVILLDGFDELLQAAGTSQNDYLERVVRFQEREADQGRPVAVVVTSRTSVADRARIPRAGVRAMRLEPFDDAQVARWLEIWNAHNGPELAARGRRPLSAEHALRQRHLAELPLLLLMLALYDAEDNALQRIAGEIDAVELYEEIFRSFARRELRKSDPGLFGEALDDAIEEELFRLSIAAVAMFTRGRLWVTDQELNRDLDALLPANGPAAAPGRFTERLTQAQLVVGRFFFIHQSRAVVADTPVAACEFLHATFGEYLYARIIDRELDELLRMSSGRFRRAPDDSTLRGYLSFEWFTKRRTVLEYLSGMFARRADRAEARALVLGLFQRAANATELDVPSHGPTGVRMTRRHAAHTLNLLLLLLLLSDSETSSRELFTGPEYRISRWVEMAGLWSADATHTDWLVVRRHLNVRRQGWSSLDRELLLSINVAGNSRPETHGLRWWDLDIRHRPIDRRPVIYVGTKQEDLRLHASFMLSVYLDYLVDLADPVQDLLTPEDADNRNSSPLALYAISEEHSPVTLAGLVYRLLLASVKWSGPELADVYRRLVPPLARWAGVTYVDLVARQLKADRDLLSYDDYRELLDMLPVSVRLGVGEAGFEEEPEEVGGADDAGDDAGGEEDVGDGELGGEVGGEEEGCADEG